MVTELKIEKTDFTLKNNRIEVLKKLLKKAIRENKISDNNQIDAQTETIYNIDSKDLFYMDYEIATYITLVWLERDKRK